MAEQRDATETRPADEAAEIINALRRAVTADQAAALTAAWHAARARAADRDPSRTHQGGAYQDGVAQRRAERPLRAA